MLPEQFTQIKRRIELSNILSDQEKKEWLFLLPKMTPLQLRELDRILSIRMPVVQKQNTEVRSQNTEVKKSENQKAKILNSVFGIRYSKLPPAPRHVHISKPTMTPLTSPLMRGERGGSQFSEIQSLTLEQMRKYSSVYTFLEELGGKMKDMIKRGEAGGHEIKQSFESSLLYKAYLDTGVKIMTGDRREELSRDEFEAIADFRAALPKILTGN